jgi:hypothetical protein
MLEMDTGEKLRVQSLMKLMLMDESIRGLPRREMERRGYRKECNGKAARPLRAGTDWCKVNPVTC